MILLIWLLSLIEGYDLTPASHVGWALCAHADAAENGGQRAAHPTIDLRIWGAASHEWLVLGIEF